MAATEQLLLPAPISRVTVAREAWRRLGFGDRLALVAFVALLIVGLIGPVLAPHSTASPVRRPFSPPGHGTLLGSDDVGRDLFTRTLYGARETWIGTAIVVGFGAAFGMLVGLIAGAAGGWLDFLLMRVTDAFLALPGPVLALAVAASLGASYAHTLLAVVVVWWPLYARLVRGEVKALAARQHFEAASLSHISRPRLWFRHLLPGAFPPVLIAMSLDLGQVVLVIAGLSFLGLGSPDPAPELGAMTARGLPYLLGSSWVALVPAGAVFIIALVSNFAGDAVRNLFAE
jgi:peptide/nickel transport system permease protein